MRALKTKLTNKNSQQQRNRKFKEESNKSFRSVKTLQSEILNSLSSLISRPEKKKDINEKCVEK